MTLRSLLSAAAPIGAALALMLVLRIVLFEPFTIPSASMEPTLLPGDYLVATKFDYGWSRHSLPVASPRVSGRLFGRTPRRGDVIILRLPRDPSIVYVKRVIGLPGETVALVDGAVFVNGRALSRTPAGIRADPEAPRVLAEQWREARDSRSWVTLDRGSGAPGDTMAPLLVPAGRYLVLGDNRDNSIDGRWSSVGLIPADNIVGRARTVLVSANPGADLLRPWTWLRWDRFLQPV